MLCAAPRGSEVDVETVGDSAAKEVDELDGVGRSLEDGGFLLLPVMQGGGVVGSRLPDEVEQRQMAE